jgi:putative transposase
MAIARSTYYEAAPAAADDTAIVEAISAICDEFECYGWRRVRAALQHRGMIINHKKIRRLMREHGLQPRTRRRYVATIDSDHDQPIYPNRTKDVTLDGHDRLPTVGLRGHGELAPSMMVGAIAAIFRGGGSFAR